MGNQFCAITFGVLTVRLNIYNFQSKPLINLSIFATVHSLMKDINLIDSCHAHLPVQ